MQGTTGLRGVYGFAWSGCMVDGFVLDAADLLVPGAALTLGGRPMRFDGPADTLLLDESAENRRLRARAARWMGRDPDMQPDADADPLRRGSLELTDGLRRYSVAVLPDAQLLVFSDGLPPAGAELTVLRGEPVPANAEAHPAVICFTPGTMIDTPAGRIAVERLRPGDLVSTRDDGPQTLIWTGRRALTGAELYLLPALRPIRIRRDVAGRNRPEADLLVSPAHRLLVTGAVVEDLFACAEVLVRARDLIDGVLIRPDHTLRSVSYVHLMFARHQIVTANGMACESLHAADAPGLLPDQRPEVARFFPAPDRHGPPARRCLSLGEAALLSHGLSRQGVPWH